MYFSKTEVPSFIQPSLVCFCSPASTSSSLPLFFLSASGITIKSFTGLSHPMNRMMRICLLNWNSHLLPPRLRPALFSPPSSFYCFIIYPCFLLLSFPLFFPSLSPSPLHILPFFSGGSIIFIFTVDISLLVPLFSHVFHICHFQMSCVLLPGHVCINNPLMNHQSVMNMILTLILQENVF